MSKPAPRMASAMSVRSVPEVVAVGTIGSGLDDGPELAGSADGDPPATGSLARLDAVGPGLLASDAAGLDALELVAFGVVTGPGVLVGAGVGVWLGGGVQNAKTAFVDTSLSPIVNPHAAPLPAHAPVQPAKYPPGSAAAESVTSEPYGKGFVQVAPQAIPPGALVTVPVPAPDLETVTLNLRGSNR